MSLNNRPDCRDGDRCNSAGFDEVLYCSLHHGDVSVDDVADAIGIRRGYLRESVNPNRAETQFQARWLVPFMKATGSRRPLSYLAAQMDCAIVALPSVTLDGDDIRTEFMEAIDEVGQSSAAINLALADRKITADEGRAIVAKLRRGYVALMEVEAAVLAKVETEEAANVEKRPAAKMPLAQLQERRMRA